MRKEKNKKLLQFLTITLHMLIFNVIYIYISINCWKHVCRGPAFFQSTVQADYIFPFYLSTLNISQNSWCEKHILSKIFVSNDDRRSTKLKINLHAWSCRYRHQIKKWKAFIKLIEWNKKSRRQNGRKVLRTYAIILGF